MILQLRIIGKFRKFHNIQCNAWKKLHPYKKYKAKSIGETVENHSHGKLWEYIDYIFSLKLNLQSKTILHKFWYREQFSRFTGIKLIFLNRLSLKIFRFEQISSKTLKLGQIIAEVHHPKESYTRKMRFSVHHQNSFKVSRQ